MRLKVRISIRKASVSIDSTVWVRLIDYCQLLKFNAEQLRAG
ncbi:hypothetical protein ADINL_0964 [Nitrincola lacisaponensis]|uniref:Uncharacterized protein n=1 Tax=Nitrincola lacisaponensis TaxID=267850 RepID=A0A063Y7I7_9GAMM|nr:hypothetical protein ADINL_0964 [Nitrincola lacisaponensis]